MRPGSSEIHEAIAQANDGRGWLAMSAQKTVLLVDDDNDIIESMRTVLEAKGYRVMVARDGNAGLTVAERENPDLIVLDMMMPKKSGFLVLEKLKGRPGGLIPTIMITGNEGSRHRAYAEMLGVRDYIRKPFAMEKLVKSVEQILEAEPRPTPDRRRPRSGSRSRPGRSPVALRRPGADNAASRGPLSPARSRVERLNNRGKR